MPAHGLRFKPYTRRTIRQAPQWDKLPDEQKEAVDLVSRVLPFRVNAYVLDELIDWDKVPDDPIYRLTFPHRDMLRPDEYSALHGLVASDAATDELEGLVHSIRMRMNPHPAGQMTHTTFPTSTARPSRACSTSTARRSCSSPARASRATRIARSASAGPSLWAWKH